MSLLVPARYVSSAVLRVHSADTRTLSRVQAQVLSRVSLAETIQRPSLDLYRSERTRLPMEDIIQTMRTHDIRIEPLTDHRFRLSFEYPDRDVAPAVVRDLMKKFQENPAAEGMIEAIEMPQGPAQSTRNLPATIGIGAGAGALLGSLVLLLRRRPWQWHLMVFGFAIAGGLAAELAAYYGEFLYPDDVALGGLGLCAGAAIGVFLLRRRARPLRKVEIAIAATAAGAILAGLVSFILPMQFESKAVMRLQTVPAQGSGTRERTVDAGDRISNLTQYTLSRSELTELIQRPALDLYRTERSRMPMEDVVKTITRDLRITPTGGIDSDAVLEISFRYPDRYKAQAVGREIVSKFMEQHTKLERDNGGGPDVPGSLIMEVLDPPGLPERPVAPDRLLITGVGAAGGLTLALLTLVIRRQSRPRRIAMLRFALGAGVAGACVAAAIAFAIPSRYVSTAALRIVQPESGARDKGIAEDLQMRIANVVSSNTLTDLIQRPSLDLYASDRTKRPIKEVIQQVRSRDLRIETLKVSAGGLTESVRVSFEYPDRLKAKDMVQALVSLLVEGTLAHPGADIPAKSGMELSKPMADAVKSMRKDLPPSPPNTPSPLESLTGGAKSKPHPLWPVTAAYVEVLDPPSMPDAPALPNRTNIIGLGLIGGLLLGPIAALLRPLARPATA
jgi:uncharacterized protein involved in exopolysaccharide biosynthesis